MDDKEKTTEEAKAPGFLGPGISPAELTGVSLEDLLNNSPAIRMLIHSYSQSTQENTSLKTDLNTLQTYFQGFRQKTDDAKTGAILLAMSNILTGFGINFWTGGSVATGCIFLFVGGLLIALGLYYSLRKVS